MPWYERPHAPVAGTGLCRVLDIPDGQGKELVFGTGKRAFRMFAVRRGSAVWAYVNACPHFQVPLNHRPDSFVNASATLIRCAAHYAMFRFEDGHCVDGPCAGESLEAIPISIDGDEIRIAMDIPG
jgi:nitrite reductase/ring-hydroxylating ferredoxin subunit